MDIQPIHTEADYKAALRVVSDLIDLDPQRFTPEGDRLEILGLLVQAYEAEFASLRQGRKKARTGRAGI